MILHRLFIDVNSQPYFGCVCTWWRKWALTFLLFASFLLPAICFGQTYPYLTWANAISGSMSVTAIKVNPSGQIYMAGNFDGTIDFDPGPGLLPITSSGLATFISSWDEQGNLLWVKTIQDGAIGISLALDDQSNIIIGGLFYDSPDFDPGPGISTQTVVGDGDAFVLKLASNGNFLWVKSFGGPDLDEITSLAVDPLGNIVSTGHFSGDVDFDPGSGSYNMTSPSSGDYTIFISKLNPNGDFVWARTAGDGGLDQGRSIITDGAGAVYITGDFNGSGDFDTDGASVLTLTSDGLDLFLLKLDANGSFVFVRQIGGPGYFGSGYSVTIDLTGNILLTGTFEGTMDFDPGPSTYSLSATGSTDTFICKLDNNGAFVWARVMGGANFEEAYSIVADMNNNYTIIGYFYSTVDFDPGAGIFELTVTGDQEIFICQLDQNGNFNWAMRVGGPLYDSPGVLTTDANGYLYVTGQFQEVSDVDPGPSTINLGATGTVTNFVLKLGEAPPATGITIYNAISPNGDNKNDLLYIENISAALTMRNKLTIFNRWGDVVFEMSDYNNTTNAFRGVNTSGTELPTGIYYYTLEFTNGEPKRFGFISLKR